MSTEILATPTKEFFIYMITRDIGLKEAIIELVDNSIDAARRFVVDDNFDGYKIELEIKEDEFIIKDNCGGMDPKVAEKVAFRFGRPSDYKDYIQENSFSIGRFGIGMKRSLFRLGRKINIKSSTKTTFFEINIDVDKWVQEPDKWNFEFSDLKTNCDNAEVGTTIYITDLNTEVKDKLNSVNFITELQKHIEVYNSKAIEKKMFISINRTMLQYYFDGLYFDENFKPAYKELIVDDVVIKVYAGIGDTGFPKHAGWYLYCNNRLVVFSDQTSLSGWGEDGIPISHSTYARFRGFVYFESSNPDKLPWNTTKTGVDPESKVFISAKTIMKKLMQIVFESIRKFATLKEEQVSEDETEEITDDVNKVLLENTKKVDIKDIKTSDLTEKFVISEVLQRKISNLVTITYYKEREMVDKVKKSAKLSSNADVGRFTFDYYCDMEEID
ncbi:histidine kinase/DNA gyrase B/HSP90-like ATPase [Anaerobacterium chartisolvens]|uniref:Histidine kinase/DNA gyrase B/HSP90-like ATPase n=1 Tax=Anaerobacterium chartisolvens TaxID=1297424 RepID=A0A369AV61_9FIRM|nr:ATP-binding protein [Anaerobacterium chartisolvens]RCX12107.1 histidine kinase/DNA gyrase B/HSP90-like ATPase [Anaerobacterium chartisolvens]